MYRYAYDREEGKNNYYKSISAGSAGSLTLIMITNENVWKTADGEMWNDGLGSEMRYEKGAIIRGAG